MVRKRKGINKRGSLADAAQIIVILFAFSVVMLIGYKISDEFNTNIQNSGTVGKMEGANAARGAMSAVNNHFPGIIDNSFLLLTIGLAIVALILAMLVAVHPVFFFFYLILLGIIIFVSGAFSNIYQEMALNPQMTTVANQLVFTKFIMTYLPLFVGIIGFLIAIVMYKTWQARQ